MTVRTCNGCPHLRNEVRPSIYPVGACVDSYCTHERVATKPLGRWVGFVSVRPEWCPLDQEEEEERT